MLIQHTFRIRIPVVFAAVDTYRENVALPIRAIINNLPPLAEKIYSLFWLSYFMCPKCSVHVIVEHFHNCRPQSNMSAFIFIKMF